MRKALIALILAGVGLLALATFVSSRERAEANIVVEANNMTPESPAVIADEGFEVEVWVNGRPLEEYVARGRHYVEALEGAEYELRIRNPLGERVAVALSVDGMNTIDARRTTAMNAAKWVLNPYQTITIRGWQMSSSRARRFYFTTERDSYGAKIGQTANLGVISAVFFRERHPIAIVPPRRPIPMEDGTGRAESKSGNAPESNSSSARDRRGDSGATARRPKVYPVPDDEAAATGIGRNVRHDVRWINMELESRPSAEVTIRYEYRAALVRLGIFPRPYPYPQPDPLPRRERSTGFEDRRYSPEP